MTAVSAGLGLVPLALEASLPERDIQASLASVILFGLTSSTIPNMFVAPAMYLRFGDPSEGSNEVGDGRMS